MELKATSAPTICRTTIFGTNRVSGPKGHTRVRRALLLEGAHQRGSSRRSWAIKNGTKSCVGVLPTSVRPSSIGFSISLRSWADSREISVYFRIVIYRGGRGDATIPPTIISMDPAKGTVGNNPEVLPSATRRPMPAITLPTICRVVISRHGLAVASSIMAAIAAFSLAWASSVSCVSPVRTAASRLSPCRHRKHCRATSCQRRTPKRHNRRERDCREAAQNLAPSTEEMRLAQSEQIELTS